jgi:hypothetical protein
MDNPQKSLESARIRVQQLVAALDSFRRTLMLKPPHELPPWWLSLVLPPSITR